MSPREDIKFKTQYRRASGDSLDGCSVIGRRFRPDWKPLRRKAVEHWLIGTQPGESGKDDVALQHGYAAEDRWFTGVWRSPTDKLFVTDARGRVHMHDDAEAAIHSPDWTVSDLGVPLDGIWGLSDDFVLAWGGTLKKDYPLFRWDGSTWSKMADPAIDIRAVHATDPENIWAVGRRGSCATWGGREWEHQVIPVAEGLTSVFTVSADEVYATGAHGALLEGSKHGWGKIGQGPAPDDFPLYSVAKWKDELYVAAGGWGLLKRDGVSRNLVTVTEDFLPTWIECRERMLITCEQVLADTADGETFRIGLRDGLLNARRDHHLLDLS